MNKLEALTLFFCGDVMTGRGIAQILPHPGDPVLHEDYLKNALSYVELAEAQNGKIPKSVDFSYIWGDSLEILRHVNPQLRIINLETSITTSDDWEDKGINYRMHPAQVPVLTAAKIDVCSLANNHVLDWGVKGLGQTLTSLQSAGIQSAGAGATFADASRPALIELRSHPYSGKRVLVFAMACSSSGVPLSWRATAKRPGVNLLPDLSAQALRETSRHIEQWRKPGDLVVVSIHWGENWGYTIPEEQITFARGLVDQAGVDIVQGHSSHHTKGMELYRGKLIVYGCGDFINDYEGIRGHEEFRGDLSVMFFPRVDPVTGNLRELSLVPLQMKKFRLHRATLDDVQWLQEILNREGHHRGVRFEVNPRERSLLFCPPRGDQELP